MKTIRWMFSRVVGDFTWVIFPVDVCVWIITRFPESWFDQADDAILDRGELDSEAEKSVLG